MNTIKTQGRSRVSSEPIPHSRGNSRSIAVWAVIVGLMLAIAGPVVAADPTLTHEPTVNRLATGLTNHDRLVTVELELTNAWQRVLQIVNRPARAFARPQRAHVYVYNEGWFHEGAMRPDFNNVDVRAHQDLVYAKYEYVTSVLNPGVVFIGRELEFNSMTKYFYTNRSLPKCRLSEAEMVEINQLYRTIGRCEDELVQLLAPVSSPTKSSAAVGNTDDAVEPGQRFARIRAIPVQTRVVYGSIIIGLLVVLVGLLRLLKR